MDIVIDASAILAVIVNEPERERIVELTSDNSLVSPGSIPWEVGNAFSAMLKQERVDIEAARRGLAIFKSIPIRYIAVDLEDALSIAHAQNLYAYDAYLLAVAKRHNAPLLTLDRPLKRAAAKMNIHLLEI